MRSGNYPLEFECESSASKLSRDKLCALLMIIFASTSVLVAIPHPATATLANQSSSANSPSSVSAASPGIVANFTFTPTNPDLDVPVYFSASSSHSNMYINSWIWDWGDGSFPTKSILSSLPNPSHTFNLPGTFTVTLTIIDDSGATATKSRNITVSMVSGDTPPAALFTFSPNDPVVGQTVTFDARASRDPDTDPIANYQWFGTENSGQTQFKASGATLVSFTHTFSTAGYAYVSLNVTDSHGHSSTQPVTFFVTRVPYQPGVKPGDFGKYYVTTNQTSFGYAFGFSQNVTQVPANNVTTSLSVLAPGGFSMSVLNETYDVRSGLGLIGKFIPLVLAANLTIGDRPFADLPFPPISSASTKTLAGAPREVNFLNLTIFSSGSKFLLEYDRITGLAVSFDIENQANGVGQKVVIVLGDTNAWRAIGNETPLPLFYPSPLNPSVGQTVYFDGSHSYDPDRETIARYQWNFGDGSPTATTATPTTTHSYSYSGTFNVTLTVTDPLGASASASRSIQVQGPAGQAPVSIVDDGVCAPSSTACRFVPSALTVFAGTTVTWANNGALPHTVYACSTANSPNVTECPVMNSSLPSFNSTILPGSTFSQTLTASGTYYYYCAIHPWMHGRVVVTSRPLISSVSAITTDTHGTITIQGSGFGSAPPQTVTLSDGSVDTGVNGTSPSIAIWDNLTQTSWTWQAGHWGNTIGIFLTSWSDTSIVIGGFGSLVGPGTRDSGGVCRGLTPYTLCAGDRITIGVWGPNNNGIAYYNLTVTGSPQGDFSISATSPSVSVGQSATSTITVTGLNYFTGTVTLSDTSLPSGLTCSAISPGSVTGSGTATLSCSSSTANTYSVTITGTSDTLTHSATATFTFITLPTFDFSLSTPSSGSLSVVQGEVSSSASIDATLVSGRTTPITFSASGLPAGVTATFTNNQCSPTCTATVSFSATATATLGTSTITINASGGGASHSTSLSLTVSAPAAFDFSLGLLGFNGLTVVQGSTSPTTSITATLVSGTTTPVTFSASGLPSGVTATFTNNSCSPTCAVMVSFSATATAALGTTMVTISASGGGASHSATISLTVNAPASFGFSLSSPSPGSLTVVQGGASPSASITATLVSGTSTPVMFSASGLPAGVTASFTNNPCGPTCTVTVTFSATGTAASGTVTISINASGGGTSHSTSLSLRVIAKASTAVSVSCSPSSVNVGRFTTCAVTVTGSYPSGDVTFTTNSSTGAFTPSTATCTLSAGACSVTYADTASSSLTAVITASYSSDANNSPGSGTFSLRVAKPTGTIAVGTSSSTVANGGVIANQGSVTGISVTITGSTAANGTPVGVITQDLSAPAPGIGTSNLASPSYYDVLVTGITTGNAQVCISFTSASSGTTMQYWSGTAWTSASNITVNGTTVCGTIPVSALTGTDIALGNPVQQAPSPADNTLIYIGAGIAAIIVLVGVFMALRRKRGSTRVTT